MYNLLCFEILAHCCRPTIVTLFLGLCYLGAEPYANLEKPNSQNLHRIRVMAPRRFSTYLLLAGFSCILLFIYSSSEPSTVSSSDLRSDKPASFSGNLPTFNVPSFHFSFRTSSHKPQEQRNSTSGESSWYSDWTWLNPFSSSITLDENRSVLPPLTPRPPVYTYYDSEVRKEEKSIKVDQQLLLTWRRAWWSHGFRPIVLGRSEARNNPLFERMQGLVLSESLEFEMYRWLAWGHMGTGLLASWHCVPMGSGDDTMISYLRRGQYPALTRFEGLGAGLFAADKTRINDAIRDGLTSPDLKSAKTILELINPEEFMVEKAGAVAHYDSGTITVKYPALAQSIVAAPDDGRLALNIMINSHLHTTWQNTFSAGIAVLKPLPAHTTALVARSLDLANLLAQCPESLMPASCPPNRPKCSPCVSSRVQVTTPSSFRNTSSLYSIGTVPHPYTMITLNNQSDVITVRHIRRHTPRDPWLTAVTRDILGSGRGGPSRIIGFKDAVASEHGRSRSLWLNSEQIPTSNTASTHTSVPKDLLDNLDWHFGFSIPRAPLTHGESLPPVPGPERWPKSKPGLPEEKRKSYEPDPPTETQLALEIELLDKAKNVISTIDTKSSQIRRVSEAWNLADTEAWRFARAYQARNVVERLKWEEDERGYGVEGRGKRRWWGI